VAFFVGDSIKPATELPAPEGEGQGWGQYCNKKSKINGKIFGVFNFILFLCPENVFTLNNY
jgi:hypothetical protein